MVLGFERTKKERKPTVLNMKVKSIIVDKGSMFVEIVFSENIKELVLKILLDSKNNNKPIPLNLEVDE